MVELGEGFKRCSAFTASKFEGHLSLHKSERKPDKTDKPDKTRILGLSSRQLFRRGRRDRKRRNGHDRLGAAVDGGVQEGDVLVLGGQADGVALEQLVKHHEHAGAGHRRGTPLEAPVSVETVPNIYRI